jgi:hypothetical protein
MNLRFSGQKPENPSQACCMHQSNPGGVNPEAHAPLREPALKPVIRVDVRVNGRLFSRAR